MSGTRRQATGTSREIGDAAAKCVGSSTPLTGPSGPARGARSGRLASPSCEQCDARQRNASNGGSSPCSAEDGLRVAPVPACGRIRPIPPPHVWACAGRDERNASLPALSSPTGALAAPVAPGRTNKRNDWSVIWVNSVYSNNKSYFVQIVVVYSDQFGILFLRPTRTATRNAPARC